MQLPYPLEGHSQPFCNDLQFCPRFILQEHFCDPYRAVYVFHFRNFVLAILRLERLRLVVAFDPTTVDPKIVSISSFLFGPIVLSIVIGLTAFLLSKKNAVVTI